MANIRTLADLNKDSEPSASAFPNPWASGGGGQAVGGQSMSSSSPNVSGPVSYLSDFGYGVQGGDVAYVVYFSFSSTMSLWPTLPWHFISDERGEREQGKEEHKTRKGGEVVVVRFVVVNIAKKPYIVLSVLRCCCVFCHNRITNVSVLFCAS